MFSVTFLGHQGWMFRSEKTCLLADPILCEEFGKAYALQYRVWPPRLLDAAAFPRVDGVLISHEHDDHFDIPSLARLDRRIPIYLSARSSVAAAGILRQMGFTVHPLVPGAPATVGDLEVLPLCGDHVNTHCGDEWDTLPYLVRHVPGDGSFFTTVDVTLTPGLLEAARARARWPGVIAWTNNAADWSHVTPFMPERGDATEPATQRMEAGHKVISTVWGPPLAMLTCAGGFSFYGDRQWLNHRVFCVDTERVCKAMGEAHRGQRFLSARPGQTLHLQRNKIKSVDAETPFLRTTPPETWPSRHKAAQGEVPDYAPATGRHELTGDEISLLRQRLDELAGSLLGSNLFKSLYSMFPAETGSRRATFAVVARQGTGRLVFEYDPNACTFASVDPADPREAYLAGMECWGADLLAVLGGELGALSLYFGRAFFWDAMPRRFNFDMLMELYRISHPLRRPAAYLRTYQRALGECEGTVPDILPP